MQAVFTLPEEGGFTVAMNEPKTVAYVVQVASFKPSAKELQEEFMNASDFTRYDSVAGLEQQQMFVTWRDEIKAQAEFKWLREPDRHTEEPSHSGRETPLTADDFIDY